MRVSTLLFTSLLGATAACTSAQGQTVITVGAGKAHDCFTHAKTGNRLPEGVAICNAALEQDLLARKDRAGTYDNRGVILDMLGRTDEAEADFNMAISLDPTLGDPYVNLGASLIKKGRYEEALVQINKGIELGVAYAHIGYYDRAVALQMLGRFKEAYYDYKKALELEPNFQMASERLKDFTVTRAPGPKPG
ncbi:MAG TPA: tetratricopeptide repeat protein [Rhizomicrobium sp.]|nr:tetratricopeptide repeat protein [Rhizomicrobium sp.]